MNKALFLMVLLAAQPATAETQEQEQYLVKFVAVTEDTPAFRPVQWRVKRLGQDATEIKSERWSWTITLPTGTYRVTVRMSGQNDREEEFKVTGEKIVTIKF